MCRLLETRLIATFFNTHVVIVNLITHCDECVIMFMVMVCCSVVFVEMVASVERTHGITSGEVEIPYHCAVRVLAWFRFDISFAIVYVFDHMVGDRFW